MVYIISSLLDLKSVPHHYDYQQPDATIYRHFVGDSRFSVDTSRPRFHRFPSDRSSVVTTEHIQSSSTLVGTSLIDAGTLAMQSIVLR